MLKCLFALVLFATLSYGSRSNASNQDYSVLCRLALLTESVPAEYPVVGTSEWQQALDQVLKSTLERAPEITGSTRSFNGLPQLSPWQRIALMGRRQASPIVSGQSSENPSLPIRVFNDIVEAEGAPSWRIGQPDWQHVHERAAAIKELMIGRSTQREVRASVLVTGGTKIMPLIFPLSHATCGNRWSTSLGGACKALARFFNPSRWCSLLKDDATRGAASAMGGAFIAMGTFALGAVVWPELEQLFQIDLGAPSPMYSDRHARSFVLAVPFLSGPLGGSALYYLSKRAPDTFGNEPSQNEVTLSRTLRKTFQVIARGIQNGDQDLMVHAGMTYINSNTGVASEALDLMAWWNPALQDYQLLVVHR